MTMNMNLAYRADIDGLRAVAVLAVVLYHAFPEVLPGGFVGVDVFFVISGFLITSIVAQEAQSGGFSFSRFYDRRFRRIAPALLVVLATSLAYGYFTLLPETFIRLAEQVAASAFGTANFYYLMHSGYFDPSSETQPMLHMWSLSVEEQFYLFWPVIIVLGWRWTGRNAKAVTTVILSVIFLASLAASVHLTKVDQSLAFYLMPTRAWELALGAMLVFAPTLNGVYGRVAPVVGLTMVAASIIVFNSSMPFPGALALLPCLGAALVIWPRLPELSGPKVLSTRYPVFLGKISYSLYLWHWPVLVFAGIRYEWNIPHSVRFALVIASILLATATWWVVEKPSRRWKPNPTTGIGFGVAGSVGISVIAAIVIFNAGFPQRFPASVNAAVAMKNYDYAPVFREGSCFLDPKQPASEFSGEACIGDHAVVLWGDSHAAHFYQALNEDIPGGVGQATASACPPVIGLTVPDRPNCKDFNDAVINKLVSQPPKTVVLAAAWTLLPDDVLPKLPGMLERTVAVLENAGIEVKVLGQVPSYRVTVPDLVAVRTQTGAAERGQRADLIEKLVPLDDKLAAHFQPSGRYISVLRSVCDADLSCPLLTDKGPVQFDYSHLTRDGASMFVGKFIEQLIR
ncbi:acyltransferase family protein [Agrobacterium genomosp. 13]|nr:acyltransferase family protein [Agrobacterium genomosp. 13]